MENVIRLSDIKPNPIPRASTGFDELDYICGYSKFPEHTAWGMPEGKISLWAGTSDIGKSRLCIEVAKSMANYSSLTKILFIQTESTLDDFASWAKDTTNYHNIHCSGASSIDEIIDTIYYVKPHIVFIDSVNEIDEFETGNKREAKRLIKGTENKAGFKQVCSELGCHLILLGQVNQDGKTIKGGTSLPHLVDIALNLLPYSKDSKSTFRVEVGIKHRHGKRDSSGIFYHTDEGIYCGSDNRLNDKEWCESHHISITTPQDRMLSYMV